MRRLTTHVRFCCLFVGVVTLSFGPLRSAEPDSAKLVLPELKTVFEERFDFANRPGGLDKFVREIRQITPGGYDLGEGLFTLKPDVGPSIVVRPAMTGPVAQLTVKLDFQPLTKADERSESQLGFVLANGQQARVHFDRKHQGDAGVMSTLRCVVESDTDKRMLREFDVKGDLPSGEWIVLYHHGLLRLTHDDKTMALAFTDANPSTLGTVGVLLGQDGKPLPIRLLKLESLDPMENDPEADAAMKQALAVTAQAFKHYEAGQFDAALQPAIEAVIHWRKARGEDSIDASNAATNLAQIQIAKNDLEGALNSYSAALEIRQKKLGEQHPLTALVHILMAHALRTQAKEEDAQRHLQAALAAFEAVYGKDSDNARVLRGEPVKKANP